MYNELLTLDFDWHKYCVINIFFDGIYLCLWTNRRKAKMIEISIAKYVISFLLISRFSFCVFFPFCTCFDEHPITKNEFDLQLTFCCIKTYDEFYPVKFYNQTFVLTNNLYITRDMESFFR